MKFFEDFVYVLQMILSKKIKKSWCRHFSRLWANFTWTLNTIYSTGGLPYWGIQRYETVSGQDELTSHNTCICISDLKHESVMMKSDYCVSLHEKHSWRLVQSDQWLTKPTSPKLNLLVQYNFWLATSTSPHKEVYLSSTRMVSLV